MLVVHDNFSGTRSLRRVPAGPRKTSAVMANPVRLTHERPAGTMRRGADFAFGNVRC